MAATDPSDYRLAPLLIARFVGVYLVLLALVMFAATAVVAIAGLPTISLVVLLVVALTGLFVLGWYFRSRVVAVHLDKDGYRVALIRSAGVRQARWGEVEEAVTADVRGLPCVVIRLRDGRTTTIPVQALAVDQEEFARDVRSRLQTGGRRRRRS